MSRIFAVRVVHPYNGYALYQTFMPHPEGFHPDFSKEKRHEKYDPKKLHESLHADFNVDIEHLAPLAAEHLGDNTTVFTGQLDERDVVVKLGAKAEAFRVEDASLRLMSEHNIPTPEVLGFKEKLTNFDEAIIIETRAEGQSMTQMGMENIRPEIIHEAGRILHTMNQIRLEGFGSLVVREGKLQGKTPDFQPEAFIFDTSLLVTNDYISEEERAIVQKVSEEIAAAYTPHPVFVHNDFTEQHIFTDGKHVTGIIDFGGSLSADPRIDIAKAHFHLPKNLHSVFDAGYGELTHDPMVKKFDMYIAARKVMYRHEAGFTKRIPAAVEILRRSIEEAR